MKNNFKRIACIIAIVLTLCALFVVPCSALDANGESTVETQLAIPASQVKSIEIKLADGPNGGIGTILQIDYSNILRESDLETFEYYIDTFISPTEWYRYRILGDWTRIGGYSNNSIYCAWTFRIDKYDGATDEDLQEHCPIKEIELTYDTHLSHGFNVKFNRPYDGNIDATIGLSNDVPWTSTMRVYSGAISYNEYSYTDGTPTLRYSLPLFPTTPLSNTTVSGSSNNPRYIPIGCRYGTGYLYRPLFNYYKDGIFYTPTNVDSYKYSIVRSATQTIKFSTSYSGFITITDMWTPDNGNTDFNVLSNNGNIESGGFEVGTFLRESIDNFMEFEILEGFSLRSVLWLVVGIGSLLALLAIFMGK